MTSDAKEGRVRACIVYSNDKTILGAILVNDKAQYKSLEQGEIWALDGISGRILPLRNKTSRGEVRLLAPRFFEEANFLAVEVVESLSTLSSTDETTSESIQEALLSEAVPESNTQKTGLHNANFLYELEDLIKQRRSELPEGSYTTHLFKGGLGKIRKKTGEEAIELILADNNEQVCAEASDLLYHMTVLLQALDLGWSDVLEQLKKR